MTSRGKSRTKPPRPSTFDDTRRLSRAQEATLFVVMMVVLLALIVYGLSA